MKVSVITVTYNAATTLAATLSSVAEQTHRDIEHILIDGGSTDATMEIATRYPHLTYCISEPDEGIYDAMNKGIRQANGTWVNFMNAGDTFFAPDTVAKVIAAARPDDKILYGYFEFRHRGFCEIVRPLPLDTPWIKMKINHQTVFYERDTLAAFPFETNIGLAADFAQLYELYHAGKRFRCLSFPIARFLDEGVGNSLQVKRSTYPIIRRHDTRLGTSLSFVFYIAYSALLDKLKTHVPQVFTALARWKLKLFGGRKHLNNAP